MLNELKRALRRAIGLPNLVTPQKTHAVFVLRFDEVAVGFLTLDDGEWRFQYSAQFQQQTEVRPLVDFPDPQRIYRRDDLWPFFLSRIPSVAQPDVQSTIDREKLDVRDPVEMLKRFGRRTIANPFVLLPAESDVGPETEPAALAPA